MDARSKFVQIVRNMAIPLVTRLPAFQRAFIMNLSGLGVAYGGSPIVDGAGERYFDESLSGGDGIRSRFLLLVGDNTAEPDLEAAARFSGSWSHVLELRRGKTSNLMLIRPDGYVAYVARGGLSAGLQSVHSLLERQIARSESTVRNS
jgi:hypothetical protein